MYRWLLRRMNEGCTMGTTMDAACIAPVGHGHGRVAAVAGRRGRWPPPAAVAAGRRRPPRPPSRSRCVWRWVWQAGSELLRPMSVYCRRAPLLRQLLRRVLTTPNAVRGRWRGVGVAAGSNAKELLARPCAHIGVSRRSSCDAPVARTRSWVVAIQ